MQNVHLIDEAGRILPNEGAGYFFQRLALIAQNRQSRVDAAGQVRYDTHALALKEVEIVLKQIEAGITQGRQDAAASIGGGHGPRDLVHRMQTILEEKRPPLNSMLVFPINTEVRPGARSYEVRRRFHSGEAVVYRGGNGADIPTVGVGMARFQAPIHYFVSKVAIDLMETWSSSFTGIDEFPGKMRHAIRLIEEKENQIVWNGDADLNLLGLLNHPYVDSALSAVPYNSTSQAASIASDVGYWANYAQNVGKGAFESDTWLIAPELETYLRNRAYSATGDKSIMQWILDANPHLKKVVKVRELSNAQGAGIHAMAFVRSGMSKEDASCEIIKPLTPTILPPQMAALGSEHFIISGFGGLNQKNSGDNVIVYVEGGV